MLRMRHGLLRTIAFIVITVCIAIVDLSEGTHASADSAAETETKRDPTIDKSIDEEKVERGHYLSIAANCEDCHTIKDGAAFAGGRELKTPFGKILSANITPDPETGIGNWSADQFYAALHLGVEPDGTHLYPAFPYNYFTKITRSDSDAIYAYLRTVNPVHQQVHRNQLPFPFRIRGLMVLWNAFFFKPGEYQVDVTQSGEWNRGAYLVQALGHCGGCHTPLNVLGAPKSNRFLHGGMTTGWLAPDLSSNQRSGLGSWSDDDIVEFLKTGRNDRAAATVDMGDVVNISTSRLEDKDLHAIANYLHTVPATANESIKSPDGESLRIGEAIYVDECSACHAMNGSGVARLIPPLNGNANVQQREGRTVVRYILSGVRATATDARPTPSAMPSFAWKLNDEQVAAVSSYIRNAWGNSAPRVTATDVSKERDSHHED